MKSAFKFIKSIILFMIIYSSIGCAHLNSNEPKTETLKNSSVNDSDTLTLTGLVNDTSDFYWYWDEIFAMKINDHTVDYFYSPQCIYNYPIMVEGNVMTIYWSEDKNCLTDKGFNKTYGLKNVPKIGLPFSTYTLQQDSTLSVTYFYKDWINKINENEGLIFPEKLYLKYKLKRSKN